MNRMINLLVNNEKRSIEVEPNDILLNVLRDKLGIKSPKCGCDRGDCGACTVLINGRSARSCLVLAIEVEGQNITTLEGLSGKEISKLNEKFLKHNSFQCGFCAPGVILSAFELLKKDPNPSKLKIQETLAGNLCRCTGYQPITDAIMDASKEI